MDLSTTPRRITEGVADLQKTRVAKSVFSIRSLVDVGDTDLSEVEDNEKIQSEFLPRNNIFDLFFFPPLPVTFHVPYERLVDEIPLLTEVYHEHTYNCVCMYTLILVYDT